MMRRSNIMSCDEGLESFHDQYNFAKAYAVNAKAAIKTLLETKHLYQTVQIEDVGDSRKGGAMSLIFDLYDKSELHILKQKSDKNEEANLKFIRFVMPKIATSCSFCGVEKAAHIADVCGSGDLCNVTPLFTFKGSSCEVYSLVYCCQSCPEESQTRLVFTVARRGMSFTLTGRSQIETVDVPKCIPKKEKKFFSDAIISKNAGKPLAALFYLRTFVEQYLRRITQQSGKSDGIRLAEAYHSMLDDDFPPQFRCMKTVYEDLSAKIHAAEDDLETFEKCHDAIVKHFNILEMMPIRASASETQ